MKKTMVYIFIIIFLSILFSCNSKKETPPPQTDISAETQIVETAQASPEQSWKETLLSDIEIVNEEDIESIKAIIEKAVENNNLEELQTFLETEAGKDKVPPQILFGLSLVYGRKGLVKEEYKIIEKLEEEVKQRPGIAFNLSLVYGRKETLKSEIDKAEAEALELLQGFISVISNPEGAEISLNEVLLGISPLTTKGIKEGTYSLKIEKTDYITITKNILIAAGKTIEVTEELIEVPGSISINSDPSGSTVFLNSVERGITPLDIPEIKAGKYELTIKKDKYEDKTSTVLIEPGKLETIDIILNSSLGSLTFIDLPDGAIINQDGSRIYPVYKYGTNTRVLKDIPIGSYEISIQKDGYKTTFSTIKITSDQNTTINGKLVQDTPYNNTRFKKKLYLDGNGDYGEIRYSSNLNLRSKISIEAWIYMDDLSNNSNGEGTWGYRNSRPIISQSHDGSTAGNYTFGITPNELYFAFESIDSRYTGSFKFEQDRWYSIAVTHDYGDGSSTKLYVDGKIIPGNWVDDAGERISGDALPERNTRGSYYIGSYNPKIHKIFFSGYIDELRVWDSIREKEAINLSLSEELYLPNENLILYYKFNNQENEIISNLAGNNNLKLNGDAAISNYY